MRIIKYMCCCDVKKARKKIFNQIFTTLKIMALKIYRDFFFVPQSIHRVSICALVYLLIQPFYVYFYPYVLRLYANTPFFPFFVHSSFHFYFLVVYTYIILYAVFRFNIYLYPNTCNSAYIFDFSPRYQLDINKLHFYRYIDNINYVSG